MKNKILFFKVAKGEDGYYIASSNDFGIFTQGKTFEELLANIKEATELYLEGENLEELGLVKHPTVLLNFELPELVHA